MRTQWIVPSPIPSPGQHQVLLATHTFLAHNCVSSNSNFTTAYPEAFLILEGEVDNEGLEAFKKQIYADVGAFGNTRLPIFATGTTGANNVNKAQLLRLRDSLREMQFVLLVRMLVAWKCAAYRAHPSLVNFAPDNGGQRALLVQQDQEEIIATAQEEGFHSLLDNLASWFTAQLITPWYDDLEMVFNVTDQPTEMERIQIWTAKTAMGATVDEWRASEAMPPLIEATNGAVEGTYVNSPIFLQAKAMADQEAMMQTQMLAGGVAGGPGTGFSGIEPGAKPAKKPGAGATSGAPKPPMPLAAPPGAAVQKSEAPVARALTILLNEDDADD